MKKIILLAVVVLMVVSVGLFLVGCENGDNLGHDDNDFWSEVNDDRNEERNDSNDGNDNFELNDNDQINNNVHPLVGTWECVCCTDITVEFRADGTIEFEEQYDDDFFLGGASWRADSGMLFLHNYWYEYDGEREYAEEDYEFYAVYRIAGNRLTITEEGEEPGIFIRR